MVNLQLLVNTEREPLLAAEPGVVAWSMLNLFRAIRGAIIVLFRGPLDRGGPGVRDSLARTAMPDGVSFVRPAARGPPAARPRSREARLARPKMQETQEKYTRTVRSVRFRNDIRSFVSP